MQILVLDAVRRKGMEQWLKEKSDMTTKNGLVICGKFRSVCQTKCETAKLNGLVYHCNYVALQ